MLVYFFRHGETEWNNLGKINGLSDIALSQSGREKTYIVKKEISKISFDKVYSSPLSRAVETAEILLDCDADKIIKCKEIIERDFGVLEGRKMSTFSIDELEEVSESHMKIYRRVMKFMKTVVKENDKDSVCMVVSHRAVLRHVHSYITRDEYQTFDINNLEFFVAEYDDNNQWNIV